MPGDTRPLRTARPASSIPDSALLQSIHEIEDAEKRVKAFQSIMQILQERMEMEKERDVLQVRMEKVSASKGANDCAWRL